MSISSDFIKGHSDKIPLENKSEDTQQTITSGRLFKKLNSESLISGDLNEKVSSLSTSSVNINKINHEYEKLEMQAKTAMDPEDDLKGITSTTKENFEKQLIENNQNDPLDNEVETDFPEEEEEDLELLEQLLAQLPEENDLKLTKESLINIEKSLHEDIDREDSAARQELTEESTMRAFSAEAITLIRQINQNDSKHIFFQDKNNPNKFISAADIKSQVELAQFVRAQKSGNFVYIKDGVFRAPGNLANKYKGITHIEVVGSDKPLIIKSVSTFTAEEMTLIDKALDNYVGRLAPTLPVIIPKGKKEEKTDLNEAENNKRLSQGSESAAKSSRKQEASTSPKPISKKQEATLNSHKHHIQELRYLEKKWQKMRRERMKIAKYIESERKKEDIRYDNKKLDQKKAYLSSENKEQEIQKHDELQAEISPKAIALVIVEFYNDAREFDTLVEKLPATLMKTVPKDEGWREQEFTQWDTRRVKTNNLVKSMQEVFVSCSGVHVTVGMVKNALSKIPQMK